MARRNRRICGSSSITSTSAPATISASRLRRGRRHRRALERHEEAEGRATGPLLRPDPAAVRLDDAATDGETETRAARRSVPRAGPVELPEDILLGSRGNARPAVADRDDHSARGRLRADDDRRARWRVLHRVLEEIDEDLLDEQSVDRDEREVLRQA